MSTDDKSRETYVTQRAAAARNRTTILEVAHDLFAESQTVSMNEIAKRAGVGAGTLYRHFPTREALILAVYRHDVQRLVDSVDEVLATQRPLDAFVTWFERAADYIRLKHGLGDALHNAAIQDAINETYAPVVGAVTRLLDACVADGSVRAGLDPGDVLLLMGFLWRVSPDTSGIAQGRRLIEIVFDGIRTVRKGQ
ncbi:TetR/AcrR family transcriptional regulator [Amycolatopsis sp. GM8]|uniref:TetR/AcrR family transcriptional regulator n=1 Tax=Amycolatopsis sp. GM8 TaxID=2896530 RepID=UPI001F44CEC6|nr:TetR/AcrR family transcriptional regulator [Amycolatopsis sp. GM8]